MAKLIEMLVSFVCLLGLAVLAQWIWGAPPTGPLGYFTWAVYLVGGIIAFSIVVSIAVGIWSLAQRGRRAGEVAGEARKAKTDAHFFYVDAAGGKGPYELSKIRLVPALALVDVEFRALSEPLSEARLNAMRAIVNAAVERLKRDVAPGTWATALPDALAPLREHDLELRGPSDGSYWYAPPETPGKTG